MIAIRKLIRINQTLIEKFGAHFDFLILKQTLLEKLRADLGRKTGSANEVPT